MSVMRVNEKTRRIISKDGKQIILHDVTEVDTSGSWLRLFANGGKYILVNTDNVLAMIIDGEKVS